MPDAVLLYAFSQIFSVTLSLSVTLKPTSYRWENFPKLICPKSKKFELRLPSPPFSKLLQNITILFYFATKAWLRDRLCCLLWHWKTCFTILRSPYNINLFFFLLDGKDKLCSQCLACTIHRICFRQFFGSGHRSYECIRRSYLNVLVTEESSVRELSIGIFS